MRYPLFLASKSASRKKLLTHAQIPYTVIEQNADEYSCDWSVKPALLVAQLADLKMSHAEIPLGKESDFCFVLTADTVGYDSNGKIYGKSSSREQAKKVIKILANGFVATGFCLEKKQFIDGSWNTVAKITRVLEASYVFEVPEGFVDNYLSKTDSLQTAGSIAIEDYGLQFLKNIQGSYTAIIGLPLFEVREALQELHFFN